MSDLSILDHTFHFIMKRMVESGKVNNLSTQYRITIEGQQK